MATLTNRYVRLLAREAGVLRVRWEPVDEGTFVSRGEDLSRPRDAMDSESGTLRSRTVLPDTNRNARVSYGEASTSPPVTTTTTSMATTSSGTVVSAVYATLPTAYPVPSSLPNHHTEQVQGFRDPWTDPRDGFDPGRVTRHLDNDLRDWSLRRREEISYVVPQQTTTVPRYREELLIDFDQPRTSENAHAGVNEAQRPRPEFCFERPREESRDGSLMDMEVPQIPPTRKTGESFPREPIFSARERRDERRSGDPRDEANDRMLSTPPPRKTRDAASVYPEHDNDDFLSNSSCRAYRWATRVHREKHRISFNDTGCAL